MNRRDFIQAIGAALAATAATSVPAVESKTLTLKKAVVAPEAVRVAPAGFNPMLPYGSAVHLSDRTEKSVEIGKELLLKNARHVLPSGTRFYVLDGGSARVVGANGEPQEIDMLAWYYTPAQLTGPRVAQVIAEVIA